MSVRIIIGDALAQLRVMPAESVHCCITSPPYFGLRSYLPDGHDDKHLEIGLEPSPDEYVAALVAVFHEVRRVLRKDGTLWLNLGDSYAAQGGPGAGGNAARMGRAYQQRNVRPNGQYDGIKPKDLIGIPWMLAFALRADGWWLRQDIIWSKPNPMPESVTDRCTKAHEYMFLLSKSERYWFDAAAIAEPVAPASVVRLSQDVPSQIGSARAHAGSKTSNMRAVGGLETRNKRSVWTVSTEAFTEAHFATFPPALIEPCILAGCPAGGVTIDPFGGAGTTGLVADRLGRSAILIELNPLYAGMSERRIYRDGPLFADVAIDPMELTDAAE